MLFPSKLNLKVEMALACLAIFLVVAGIAAWYAVSRMETHERRVIADQQYALVHALAQGVDGKVLLARSALEAAGRTIPADAAGKPVDLQKFLDERVTLHSFFTGGLFLFTPDGSLLNRSPRGCFLDGKIARDCVSRTGSTGLPSVSAPFTHPSSPHRPIIMLTTTVSDRSGRLRFVLAGNLDLLDAKLVGELKEFRIGTEGEIFLSTRDRTLLFHRDNRKVMEQAAAPGRFPLYDRALEGSDLKGESSNAEGKRVVSSFSHLPTAGWMLGAQLPVSEAYAGMYIIRRHLLWGFGAGSLAMMILTWIVMRHLTRPLMTVTQQVREMRGGQLRPITFSSTNEIGTLAAAFNELLERLESQQESLQEVLGRQQAIIDNVPDMAWLKDRDGRFITVNGQFTTISGWQNDEIIGKTDDEVWSPEVAKICRKEDGEVMATGSRRYAEERVLDRIGRSYFMEVIRTPIFGARGEIIGIIGIAHDITARKQEELELRYASTHDRLTGLYNRGLFDQELDRLSRSRKYPISIIMADVNDLKVVNDTHGHQAGDRLLAVAARALLAAFRAEDVVARIGGDEFAVLLPETDDEAAQVAVKRVIEQLEKINAEEAEFQVNIAFGIATAFKGDELLQALQLSDQRMYANKAEQKQAAASGHEPNPLDFS